MLGLLKYKKPLSIKRNLYNYLSINGMEKLICCFGENTIPSAYCLSLGWDTVKML